MWVCDPTVTSPVPTASRMPAQETGGAPVREGALLLDERGREVHHDRDLVAIEDRERTVGEVRRPVVERHDDGVLGRRVRCLEQLERSIERRDPAAGRELRHLVLEAREGQVQLEAGPGPDPVVDEHHDPAPGPAQAVGRHRRRLQPACRKRSHLLLTLVVGRES